MAATVKEMKATARPKAGKGAARAVRRSGRVPGVIYGDNKDPLAISVDHAELKQRIYAGRFLTTIYELDVDGTKHRVIPRDFQLDAVKDLPLHVDFLRLSAGAKIRVRIPVHVLNADQSPGVKRGGTVNIVTHAIEVICSPEEIPESIDVDVSGLEINYSKHMSDVTLPPNVQRGGQCRPDAGHHRAAVGLRRRNEGGCRSCCCRCRRCRGRRGSRRRRRRRPALHPALRLARLPARTCGGRARRRWRQTRSKPPRACHRPLDRAMTYPPLPEFAACPAACGA